MLSNNIRNPPSAEKSTPTYHGGGGLGLSGTHFLHKYEYYKKITFIINDIF